MNKIDKLVNNLDNIKEKIEQNNIKVVELKEENKQSKLDIKDVKKEILSTLEDLGLNALSDNKLINHLYWDLNFHLKELGSAIGVHNKLLKIKPITKVMYCKYCELEYEITKDFKQSSVECPNCEERHTKRKKELEERNKQCEISQTKWELLKKELHTIPYREYLQTDRWKKTRYNAMKSAGFKCQLCGATNKKLNTHHNTYERRGYELPSDLMVLCEECHETYSMKK